MRATDKAIVAALDDMPRDTSVLWCLSCGMITVPGTGRLREPDRGKEECGMKLASGAPQHCADAITASAAT